MVKRGKFPCGYKVHVNTDESGIMRRLEMTPANVHDSSKLRDLMDEKDTKAIYADKGYDSRGIRSWCDRHNIECLILRKGKRNKPLTEEEIIANESCPRNVSE